MFLYVNAYFMGSWYVPQSYGLYAIFYDRTLCNTIRIRRWKIASVASVHRSVVGTCSMKNVR